MSEIHAAALRYVEKHGLKLVPLRPRQKIPEGNGWGLKPIATMERARKGRV